MTIITHPLLSPPYYRSPPPPIIARAPYYHSPPSARRSADELPAVRATRSDPARGAAVIADRQERVAGHRAADRRRARRAVDRVRPGRAARLLGRRTQQVGAARHRLWRKRESTPCIFFPVRAGFWYGHMMYDARFADLGQQPLALA